MAQNRAALKLVDQLTDGNNAENESVQPAFKLIEAVVTTVKVRNGILYMRNCCYNVVEQKNADVELRNRLWYLNIKLISF